MSHPAYADAVAHLRAVDPVIGDLIERVDKLPPAPPVDGSHLGAIIRSIVFQQLSGKAAGTIHARLLALFGGRSPTADELLATPDEVLRSAGLSRGKTLYLKDLARHVHDGTLPIDRLHELDDSALIEALTSVKGIGRWTAQMFLLFRLGRPDVLPDLDLGVRKAIQRAYRLRRMPTPKEVLSRGAAWSPFASFAAWYLWRSLELPGTVPAGRRSASRARPSVQRRRAAVKRTAAKSPRGRRPRTKARRSRPHPR